MFFFFFLIYSSISRIEIYIRSCQKFILDRKHINLYRIGSFWVDYELSRPTQIDSCIILLKHAEPLWHQPIYAKY